MHPEGVEDCKDGGVKEAWIEQETQEQRTFQSRLDSYFYQNVNKDGVCECLLIRVARIVHQFGSLLPATWVYTGLLLSSVIAHSNWILCEL